MEIRFTPSRDLPPGFAARLPTRAHALPIAVAVLIFASILFLLPAGAPAQQLPTFGSNGIHDPSTMVKDGSTYFVYGDGTGVGSMYSTDLQNWNMGAAVFPNGAPGWTGTAVPGFGGDFWAPDIHYFNGAWHLYYSCSNWGTIVSAIGVATSPSLTNPVWTDLGKVVQSNSAAGTNVDYTAYNCIDPCIFQDTDGTVWLTFGSYSSGILLRQINPATGLVLNTTSTLIANNASGGGWGSTEEGSELYKHNGYYYLFTNWGGCCDLTNSTYNIRVGRSTSITGPYLDKNGVNLKNSGGTLICESSGRFIGPGHAGILYDNGTYWFTCHYYDGLSNGFPRLSVQPLRWSADDWPYLSSEWSAFYPFAVDARESTNIYDGAMNGGASITSDATRGNVLALDGSSGYVSLPLSVASASTFSAWVKWNGGAAYQRIFDFGTSTTNYLYLTPTDSKGVMRLGIQVAGGGEQFMEGPTALPANTWTHVAVTMDGSNSVLYLNGIAVSSTTTITNRPWQVLATNNYIGKSEFSTDPFFSGEVQNFRIYSKALSATDVATLANQPLTIANRYSFSGDVTDSVGLSDGRLFGNATIKNGALQLTGTRTDYVNMTGGLVSGASAVTMEAWVTLGTNSAWARILDFGDIFSGNGANYLFLSPHSGSSTTRLGMSTSAATINFDGPGVLDNKTSHLVVIADPPNNFAAAYVNGVLAGQYSGTIPAMNGVSSSWSFIGHSLFSTDPGLNGSVDELRIYDGRLTPQQIALDYQLGPDILASSLLTWTASGSHIWDKSTSNWNNGTAGAVWADNLPALFTGTGAGAITIATSVAPQAMIFSGAGYVLSASGTSTITLGAAIPNVYATSNVTIQAPLVGNGGLGKSGSGSLILTSTNTYTGNTSIVSGTLSILTPAALYAGGLDSSAILTIDPGATLLLDRWSYGPAGTGYQVQSLGGLAGGPAHIVVNGGTIRYTGGAAGAPQDPSQSPYGSGFTIGPYGATLDAAKAGDTWTVKYDSRGTGYIAANDGGNLTLTGSGNGVLDKALPGTGGLIKSGTGTWSLTRGSSFTGSVVINSGTLYANCADAANGATCSYTSGITVSSGATLESSANALFGWDNTQVRPVTVNSGATLVADGGSVGDVAMGTVTLLGGTMSSLAPSPVWGSFRFDNASSQLIVTNNSTVSAANVKFGNSAAAITIASGKILNFTGSITDASSGGISYLTQNGAGTLILSGSSNYSGATTISAGTLTLPGSISGTSAVTIGGATLTGSGTMGGSVTFSGSAHELLTISAENGSGGGQVEAGLLTVAPGAVVDVTFNAAGSTVNFYDPYWTQTRTWTAAGSAGMSGAFVFGTVTADPAGNAASTYGTLSLAQGGSGAALVWTPKGYTAWRGTMFGASAGNAAVSGFSATPAGDGLANGEKYFYDMNAALPGMSPIQQQVVNGFTQLTFPRNAQASDVTAIIQGADTPAGPWSNLAQSTGGGAFSASMGGVNVTESGTGTARTVQFTDLYQTTDPAHPHRFFRVWLEQN